jgi:DNA replication protein DnaC
VNEKKQTSQRRDGEPETIREALARAQRSLDETPRIEEDASPAPDCDTCGGLGQYWELLKEGIPGVSFPEKRLVPCPSCEKGQSLRRELLDKRLTRTKLPERYAEASLSKWGNPAHGSREGKVQAFFACREFVSDERHYVSSHNIANRILNFYDGKKPNDMVLSALRKLEAKLELPDSVRNGLVLWGDYGVGKTWLAAAAMNDLAKNGEYVLYMRMSQLLQTLRDTWKGEEKTGDLLQHYSTVPILFIDDMSDNSADDKPLAPHQQDFAAAIMRNRMGDMLPTIVTANWEQIMFEEKWGSVCSEVMFECLHWIKVGGAKLRDITTELDVDL